MWLEHTLPFLVSRFLATTSDPEEVLSLLPLSNYKSFVQIKRQHVAGRGHNLPLALIIHNSVTPHEHRAAIQRNLCFSFNGKEYFQRTFLLLLRMKQSVLSNSSATIWFRTFKLFALSVRRMAAGGTFLVQWSIMEQIEKVARLLFGCISIYRWWLIVSRWRGK